MRKYCGAWTRSAHACTRRGGPMNSGAHNLVILYFSAVVGIGKDSSILERLGSLGQSMLKASRLRLRRRSQAAERFLPTRHAEDTSLRGAKYSERLPPPFRGSSYVCNGKGHIISGACRDKRK